MPEMVLLKMCENNCVRNANDQEKQTTDMDLRGVQRPLCNLIDSSIKKIMNDIMESQHVKPDH